MLKRFAHLARRRERVPEIVLALAVLRVPVGCREQGPELAMLRMLDRVL
jgi:hypothetical protein